MPSSTKSKKPTRSPRAKTVANPAPTARSPKLKSRVAREGISPASSITNYTTALRWLYDHTDHERLRLVRYNERTFNLGRMKKLLDLMGNPHDQIKCVHIAGTKGKGSTCAMIASMLENCGYTVGLYTSPHLIDLRERITINSHMISYNDMAEAFKKIAAVEGAFKDQPPTFFEIMTAAAFQYFADQAVDIAVLETGLGGRLDCTTVCNPLVTAITSISKDHTHLLGNELTEIAREKAGIFKRGVAALSVEQEPDVADVFRTVAAEVGTEVQFTGKDLDFSHRFEANKELGPHSRVSLTTERSRFEHLAVPLRGEHQAHNCGLALAVLDRLKLHGYDLPEDKVIAGLANTKLDGRMEQVWTEPRIIIDGAHNAASVAALIKALGAHVSYDSLVLIFGCGQDKDVRGMLKQVSLGADKIIFTRAKNNPRAEEPSDLLTRFNELSGKMAQTAPDLESALKLAARAVSREDLIVVTGSFYLAGEARKYFHDVQTRRARQQS